MAPVLGKLVTGPLSLVPAHVSYKYTENSNVLFDFYNKFQILKEHSGEVLHVYVVVGGGPIINKVHILQYRAKDKSDGAFTCNVTSANSCTDNQIMCQIN